MKQTYSSRSELLDQLAARILGLKFSHPTRVGINGVDGSGKTVLAADLVRTLRSITDREIIAASIDSFHNPRAIRYGRGRRSAEGYYRDSYNIEALIRNLLAPLGSTEPRYRSKAFDLKADAPINQPLQTATNDAILIFEGIFCFQPKLAAFFDYKLYLEVPFEVTLARLLERDVKLFESQAESKEFFEERYRPGQQLYVAEAQPEKVANIIIDNSDYQNPILKAGSIG